MTHPARDALRIDRLCRPWARPWARPRARLERQRTLLRRRWARRWARLRLLEPGEAWLGAQVPLLLPLAAWALDRWGLGGVQERLAAATRPRPAAAAPADALAAARRIAWTVEVVARHSGWHVTCLQRSVTLWWLLARRGLRGDLRVGVRRRPDGPPGSRELDFHAWVEHEGTVLNDAADVRSRFATFDRAIAPRRARWQ